MRNTKKILIAISVFCPLLVWAKPQPMSSAKRLDDLLMNTHKLPSQADRIARADALDRMGLYFLALSDRIDLIRNYKPPVSEWAKLGETALIFSSFESVGKNVSFLREQGIDSREWPTSIRVALAGFYFSLRDIPQATNYLPSLSDIKKLGPNAEQKALVLTANIFLAQGKVKEAYQVLQGAGQSSSGLDPGIIFLQRSRLAYEQGNNAAALEELLNLPRNSPSWYPGMMVSAWSAYRLKDYNLSLGLLMSLHSPYLYSKFNPESYILEAATMYRLCHYESAARSLALLKDRYKGLANNINRYNRNFGQRFLGVSTALNYARGQRAPKLGINGRHWSYIMDGLLTQEPLVDVDRVLTQAMKEKNLLSKVDLSKNRFTRELSRNYFSGLEQLRLEALRTGVKVVGRRLQDMKQEVNDAIENSLAVEVEINTRVRERLATGIGPRMKEIDFDAEIKKGYEFWPFQGEFWRDEAGSYIFATTDVCGSDGRGG